MIENELSSPGLTKPDPDELSGIAADFSSRCMALLIDSVFLGCLVVFSLFLFFRAVAVLPPANLQGLLYVLMASWVLLGVWPLLLSAFYFIVLHSFGGQTLGKVFMGIIVVDDQGGMLPLGSSFLRLVGYFLSSVPLGAGFLWAALDQHHSAWHDKLACSRVIYL